MDETTAETRAESPSTGIAATTADAIALKQLQHVGAAYGVIFVLLFAFAWRATSATRRLADRVADLEREHRRAD